MKMRRPGFPPAFYVLQLSVGAMPWIILFSADAKTSDAFAVWALLLVPVVIVGQLYYFKSRLVGDGLEFHEDPERRIFGTPGGYTFVVAVSTLAVVVGAFANAYYVLSLHGRDCFGSSLSRIDAIYFTMTTLSTVGYGDIAPTSGTCRLIASGQMLVTMLFLTIFVGLLVAVLSRSNQSR